MVLPAILAGLARAAPVAFELGKVGKKQVQQIGIELFGYDFINLLLKLFVFSLIAIAIEKFHFVVTGTAGVASYILSIFGLNMPTAEPDFLKRLFSEEGFNGFRYWDIVKALLIVMVAMEMLRYIETNKKMGGKPDTVTLGVFGILLFALTAFTIPDMINKLKMRFSREQGV